MRDGGGLNSIMPDQTPLSLFLGITSQDPHSLTPLSYISTVQKCRQEVNGLEESLDLDLQVLSRIRKSVRSVCTSGLSHVEDQESFVEALQSLGNNQLSSNNHELSTGFLNLSVLSRELSALFSNMINNMNSILSFPLDSLLRGELKDGRSEAKKQTDKSWKDFEIKMMKKIRSGASRADSESPEEAERDRRMFQLHMCEYLLKLGELQVKQGPDFLQCLNKFFHAQHNFFQDGLNAAQSLLPFIEKLSSALHTIHQAQDEELKQLSDLRDNLQKQLQIENKEEGLSRKDSGSGYSLHQPQGDKQHGSEKSGFLYKKSEGIRKVWQKRKCGVKYGFLTISHSTINRPPVKIKLLTCQVRPNLEDKRNFDLVTHNRTYHLQAEDEFEAQIWVSVLQNSKEESLNAAFGGDGASVDGAQQLTKQIISEMRNLPGNQVCCDCGAPDPSWVSTNLGVLICIECSGIHRDLGVRHSRVQSLTLDMLSPSELLVAFAIGNTKLNEVLEAVLPIPNPKPTPSSDMIARKDYICSKYVERSFVVRDHYDAVQGVRDAIQNQNMKALLQSVAWGAELGRPLPSQNTQDVGEYPLHLAVRLSERMSVPLVDFIIQNGGSLDRTTKEGDTALHYGVKYNKPDCIRLLLKAKASLNAVNNKGLTPLMLAQSLNHVECEELLEKAQEWMFQSEVDFDWFRQEEEESNSEEEEGEKLSPLFPKPLPLSPIRFQYQLGSSGLDISNRTYETIVIPSRPPAPQRSRSEEAPPPLPAKSSIRRCSPISPLPSAHLERPLSALCSPSIVEECDKMAEEGLRRRASEPPRYSSVQPPMAQRNSLEGVKSYRRVRTAPTSHFHFEKPQIGPQTLSSVAQDTPKGVLYRGRSTQDDNLQHPPHNQ
ncbi:arf-GAP with SH3 domain, ANK repeat and PH domain-containing protein 3 [Bombina bombina]|uniref:arf-GAP with SH3 domain, ANK repeat and PH domain-containing protein 3 n=1 Tax=Bombina bombina TaxID=8345 RepID=UPI00235AABA1|nr:arf-GAP with SH3 domain, ANK repeat and PH domain-containing protein 3 [Bombina bombina]